MKKNKKKKEESIEDVKQKYPFADEMLTTIRQEYETENDRKKTLDTKASTFITVEADEILLAASTEAFNAKHF